MSRAAQAGRGTDGGRDARQRVARGGTGGGVMGEAQEPEELGQVGAGHGHELGQARDDLGPDLGLDRRQPLEGEPESFGVVFDLRGELVE